jgi:hypothetical protein
VLEPARLDARDALHVPLPARWSTAGGGVNTRSRTDGDDARLTGRDSTWLSPLYERSVGGGGGVKTRSPARGASKIDPEDEDGVGEASRIAGGGGVNTRPLPSEEVRLRLRALLCSSGADSTGLRGGGGGGVNSSRRGDAR